MRAGRQQRAGIGVQAAGRGRRPAGRDVQEEVVKTRVGGAGAGAFARAMSVRIVRARRRLEEDWVGAEGGDDLHVVVKGNLVERGKSVVVERAGQHLRSR
eukprot:6059016-Pleurochrysis_carterae.AAC.1